MFLYLCHVYLFSIIRSQFFNCTKCVQKSKLNDFEPCASVWLISPWRIFLIVRLTASTRNNQRISKIVEVSNWIIRAKFWYWYIIWIILISIKCSIHYIELLRTRLFLIIIRNKLHGCSQKIYDYYQII